jgi:glycosyltransferase involved in cell wall biosynthesis
MRKRVLLAHPAVQPYGGGGGVASWMLEALQSDYSLSVLTWNPVIDPAAINRFYGTHLDASRLEHIPAYPQAARLQQHVPLRLDLLRSCLVMRRCQRLATQFDIVIGVHNEADYGCRAIQYVHYPSAFALPRPEALHWYHANRHVVRSYHRVCQRLAHYSEARMRRNLTLVNSDWTGERVRERYRMESVTLYPPVPGAFPPVEWNARESGFVCVGRISPEKGLDRIMDILAAVRARGHSTRLHIVGMPGIDGRYNDHIRRRVAQSGDWVGLEENVSRERLAQIIAAHRYGIHGASEEHFGIAVAEMVRAGCIVFVPDGGGQVEIVGNADDLRYRDDADAVEKIAAVLGSPERQQTLRGHLAERAPLFGADLFVRRTREIVRDFL